MVQSVFVRQSTAFKLNISFGFILRNVETGELRYFHTSYNNHRFFEVPHLIRNQDDVDRFLTEFNTQDLLEFVRQQRPDTKWIVHLLTNVTFYVNKIQDHVIGSKVILPSYVKNNRAIIGLVAGSNGPYQDNLCLFRCLAVHAGVPVTDVETPAKTYFNQYLTHMKLEADRFEGVAMENLHDIENLFHININVYELKENEEGDDIIAELVRRSPYSYEDTVYLNLYRNHYSYIKDLDQYSHSFACQKCSKLWSSPWMLHRHERTCEANVQYRFPGGVYHTPQTVFEKLDDAGIEVNEEDRFYPYRATYDIEVMLKDTDRPNTDKIEWTNQHVPLSISICSNIEGFETPICLVSDGNPDQLASKAVQYLNQLSTRAYQLLRVKYEYIFSDIEDMIGEDIDPADDDTKKKQHPLHKLQLQLENYMSVLPVIGFNSGRYDLNAMKTSFFSYLADQEDVKFAIKRNNTFMCVTTAQLKFLDITNYLAPGFSYSQFLKAYECQEQKGFFPYEWMTSLDKLEVTSLPPHDAFYSTLKKSNITEEEYQLCQQTWNANKMTTMKDFLIWYNNKDVEPMLEAIEKMCQYYKDLKVDMFKDGISVPGLTLKIMFDGLTDYFTIPDDKNKDLYDLYKTNIVGGPSIVFHRYQEKDVTFIRPAEFDDPKPCKKVIGFDANALYLWSIMQPMPTGHFVRRKKEDGFKRQTPRRYERMAIEWLEWEAQKTGHHIRHQGNDKEKVIGQRRLPVDGYCKDTNTVYEFQGCLWHGHRCWMTKDKTVNPINGKNLDELYKTTGEKIAYIKEEGYEVKQMWECEWERLKLRDPQLNVFVRDRQRPCDRYTTMTEESILQAVMEDKLFGALEVDLHVPEILKGKFAEMPPVFKNVDVSRDDIGDHMQAYAEEKGIMNQKRRSLIGSMFGEKILIISPLLKWYVQHGLKVTQIHQVVEYTPSTTFKAFGEQISDARRAGDADPNKKIVAETKKLEGNSSYGKTVTNKERHRRVVFCDEKSASRVINNPFFRKCNQLSDTTFEIELSKKRIDLDLPSHIGCFVYQYAKLRMLQFYYDFMDTFVDRRDFQYCSMDTDSAYMALSGNSLDDVIRPHLKDKYHAEKHEWFPRSDTPEHAAFDKRTPGLFKEEYSGDGIVALCSKTYYCFGAKDKFSCKGINKRTNDITKEMYMNVLKTKEAGSGINRGFRSMDNRVYTYLQERTGFSYFYSKRKVLADGISTVPLDI